MLGRPRGSFPLLHNTAPAARRGERQAAQARLRQAEAILRQKERRGARRRWAWYGRSRRRLEG